MSCKSFVVDRAKWGRGNETMLLNGTDGKMCCLGFAALACGYSKDDILDRGRPEDLVVELKEKGVDSPNRWFDGLVKPHPRGFDLTGIGARIISANDDDRITDHEREAVLRGLFLKLGVEVKFEGGQE